MILPDDNFPVRPSPPVALFGREEERQTLRSNLAAALAGHGRVALISGEAGIGKTALAEAIYREARGQGALVLLGRCYDLAETPPYGPWLELFARYPAESMDSRDDLPPLPAVFTQPDGIGAVASQSGLLSELQGFLTALAACRPIVLLLDDLHWADPASLDLFRFVARTIAMLPVLLLATYRSDELTRSHPFHRLVPLVVREAQASRLELRPLDDDGVRAMVRERYGLSGADTARFVTYLQERAQGNPFFLGELVRALEGEGALGQAGGRWVLGSLADVRLPMLLKQVIEARLARVEEEARRLLAVAAVIGQEVPYALWAAVAAVAEDALLAIIEPALEALLLVETPDGTHAQFAHALIRAVLYEGILPSRRRRMHRQVAERLAARPNVDPDLVAYHFRQAGDERAILWLVRAGGRAERALALLTAAERYEAAVTLLGASETAIATMVSSERGWLLHALARTRRYITPRQGVTYLEEAESIAATTQDDALMGVVLRLRGLLRCYTGDVRRGLAEMEAAVTAIRALSTADRAHLTSRLAGTGFGEGDGFGTYVAWLGMLGRSAEARALGEPLVAAMAATPAAGLDPGDAIADAGLGPVYTSLGMPEQATAAFARYRANNLALGDYAQVHAAWSYEAMFVHLPYYADQLHERQRIVEETERARIQAHGTMRYPPNYMVQSLLFVAGAWDEIAAIHQAVRDAGVATQVHQGWAGVLGPLAHAQGNSARAWAIVRAVFPAGSATEPGELNFLDVLPVILLAAALATDVADLPAARAWLEMHDHWLAWSGALLGRAEGAVAWSVYHVAAGNPGQAHDAANRALTHAREPRQPLALLAAHRRLGELATAAGRYGDAAAHLDAALALADACNARYERALTLLSLAALKEATNDETGMPVLLEEARLIGAPLGATPLLARADTLAAHSPAVPTAYPDGLTAREVDVLREIAAGKSNKEIADRLSISGRTVDRHIANVYIKIGAHNKADAAAYAFRHHLAR